MSEQFLVEFFLGLSLKNEHEIAKFEGSILFIHISDSCHIWTYELTIKTIVTLVTDGMVHTYRDGKAISRKHMHEKWFFITTTYYVNHIKCASSINYQDDVIDKRKDGLQFSK